MWQLIHKKKLRRKIKNSTLSGASHHDDVMRIIRDLRVSQLRDLLMSIRTRGGICSCINKTMTTATNKSTTMMMMMTIDEFGDFEAEKLLMCRAFRWPDMPASSSTSGHQQQQQHRLLRIPNCSEEFCINPFHYSVWQQEETSSSTPTSLGAPLQSEFDVMAKNNHQQAKLQTLMTSSSASSRQRQLRQPASGIKKLWKKFCISDDSEQEQSIASVTSSSAQQQQLPVWCKLVYWEGRKRVGRQFPVNTPHINIFNSLPRGEGFCLAALDSPLGGVFDDENAGGGTRASSSARIRARIGHGITIVLTNGDVIMHNRSEHPVFVHSPVVSGSSIRKLKSGGCMRIFRFPRLTEVGSSCDDGKAPGAASSELTSSSIRVSFVKGWGGPDYKRTCLLTCPCWLEIYCRNDFRYTS